MKKLIFGLLAIAVLLASCGGGNTGDIPLDDDGNEKFGAFLTKFLADSAFQYSRIEFPLQLIPNGKFNDPSSHIFIEETDWKRHVPFDSTQILSGQIKQEVENMGGYVQEHIFFTGSFYMRREFNLNLLGQWELTKFIDMQDPKEVFGGGQPKQNTSSGVIDTTVIVDINDTTATAGLK